MSRRTSNTKPSRAAKKKKKGKAPAKRGTKRMASDDENGSSKNGSSDEVEKRSHCKKVKCVVEDPEDDSEVREEVDVLDEGSSSGDEDEGESSPDESATGFVVSFLTWHTSTTALTTL
jgi:hypothetical protein